jgi:hypothetical protein
MVNQVYERTKQECAFKDIKPASFLPEDRVEGATGSRTQVKLSNDRELAGKIGDASKPLTLEELRAMIE